MVDHQLETRGSADAFDSFAELQRAHLKMMTFEERQRSIVGDSNSESKARKLIQEFIQKVRNTGMRIGDATERLAAQNILNYWSAETISIDDLGRNDLSPTKLLPFVPSLAQGQAATQSADEINRLKDARKKIQMGGHGATVQGIRRGRLPSPW